MDAHYANSCDGDSDALSCVGGTWDEIPLRTQVTSVCGVVTTCPVVCCAFAQKPLYACVLVLYYVHDHHLHVGDRASHITSPNLLFRDTNRHSVGVKRPVLPPFKKVRMPDMMRDSRLTTTEIFFSVRTFKYGCACKVDMTIQETANVFAQIAHLFNSTSKSRYSTPM